MSIKRNLIIMLATFFGIGYLPFCPGTFASFAAIGVYFLIEGLSIFIQIVIISLFIFLGMWASHYAEIILRNNDPKIVVIDEVVGYLITMCFIPFNIAVALTGFFLFRFYDILKPFPIKRIEKFPGGPGIILDDIIAGIYACITVRIILMIKHL